MLKLIQFIVVLFGSALMVSAVFAEPDVAFRLKRADGYRLDNDASKVVSKVSLYENEELSKTRLYNVYTRPNRQSLVIFKSPAEAGQKMLMLEDNYWLLMPKSRRPIRITPMQKLLGEASVGDISTLTWSEDYQGEWVKDDVVSMNNAAPVQASLLSLESITKGASYHRIELWLEHETDFPLKANLYLRSGKLAKEAWFIKGNRNSRTAVTAMILLDKIQPHKKTEIEYQSITPVRLEDKYYNPAYLSRNKVSDL